MTEKTGRAHRGTVLIGGAVVLALVIGFGVWKKNSKSEVTYDEVRPSRADLDVVITSTGTVAPENRLEIKPPVAGRVETVLANEGDRVRRGKILAWMSSTERAGLLDAARAKGEEEVKKWEELYRPTPIIAPIDGTIILRNVEPGQTFSSNDAVFVISDRLTTKAQVDETDIAQIKLGMKAQVVLDSYPKSPIVARVDQIAFDAKTVNNVTTYIVDVLPEKAPAFMRSGMTANVTFYVTSRADALVVPSEAIKAEAGRFYVLTPNSEDRRNPARKPIETGVTDGKRTEVIAGVSESDTVLIPKVKLGAGKDMGTSPFSPIRPRRSSGPGGGGGPSGAGGAGRPGGGAH